MLNAKKKQIEWNGVSLTLETGRIARLATASVLMTMGETVVLCTVVGDQEATQGAEFLPLTVHYLEKFYASGRIPGGFLKREGKPSEREVLISRLIDRSIRPLFPEGYYNSVQVICTVMSYDGINEPDILGVIGTSVALAISEIPFSSTIGAVRVGYENGSFVFNQKKNDHSLLELIIAGTKDSVLMVESEAKELSESVMLEAIVAGQQQLGSLISMIDSFIQENKKPKWSFEATVNSALKDQVFALVGQELAVAYSEPSKALRSNFKKVALNKAQSSLASNEISGQSIAAEVEALGQKLMRDKILNNRSRIDGRHLDEIRPIVCELDILPKVHGSALFTRGETQALVVATIGTTQDEQMLDDLLGNRNENLMLHYNFPPYAVCESSPLRAPGRREIGHGRLALKAISAVIPSKSEFPYTVRLVSEITESNGSSSMATVCGASLSMMAAGIPLKRPVAGIAMGLIKEGENFAVLSDIMGDEDALGDMDFKVAGTEKGITALQMDIKIQGISKEIMQHALTQAQVGIKHIMSQMAGAIQESRKELSSNAPRIVSIQIDKDKIREVIGTGGKVIRDICEKSKAKVDIEESGKINVAGVTTESIDLALKMIREIVAVPELGKTYAGVVTKLAPYGAFVRFLGTTEGLVHISEVANERVEDIADVLKEGEAINVQVIGIERGGKVRLSMKSLLNGGNFSVSRSSSEGYGDRGDRGDRGGRGGERSSRFGGGSSGGRSSSAPRSSSPYAGKPSFGDDKPERNKSREGGNFRSYSGGERRSKDDSRSSGNRDESPSRRRY